MKILDEQQRFDSLGSVNDGHMCWEKGNNIWTLTESAFKIILQAQAELTREEFIKDLKSFGVPNRYIYPDFYVPITARPDSGPIEYHYLPDNDKYRKFLFSDGFITVSVVADDFNSFSKCARDMSHYQQIGFKQIG